MKKFIFLSVTLFVLLSCKKPPLEFSCDPKVNEFVVENRKEFAKIAVNELVSYNPKVQRAIFNSWDYQKKRRVWLDKLQYVLSHTQLNKLEKDHIEELINHINDDYFKKENINVNNAIQVDFAKKWISYSFNELKWDNEFIAFLVYRLYTDESQFDAERSNLKTTKTSIYSNSESCNCNSSIDFCGGACSTGSCSITTGCGWLWSMNCNGSCY